MCAISFLGLVLGYALLLLGEHKGNNLIERVGATVFLLSVPVGALGMFEWLWRVAP